MPDGTSVSRLLDDAKALMRQGRLFEAEERCRAALVREPGHTDAQLGLGIICSQTGRHAEAVVWLVKVLEAKPDTLFARNELALSLTKLGRYGEAAEAFENVLRLMPGSHPAAQNMAIAYKNIGRDAMKLGRNAAAAEAFERALRVLPDYKPASYGLGDMLNKLGRPQEALAVFEKMLSADPADAMAWLGAGDAKKSIGFLGEARAAYEHAVALQPKFAVGHRLLAECARFAENDPRLAALEALAREENALSAGEVPDLHFALAKAYDDLNRYGEAFAHLEKANRLKRGMLAYDEGKYLGELRWIREVFTREFLAGSNGSGELSEVPVFVVGMPRSGTSLVEQILASHSAVFGAGELSTLEILIQETAPAGTGALDAEGLDARRFSEIGRRYVQELGALAPQALRITDKMTGNFRLIGLIRLALPGARIIHVLRDPLDTCFSCYFHDFDRLEFTYDPGELGRDYRAYEELMAHWRNVLPDGAMLEVRYEELVEDFEPQVRRILDYCGLKWDTRCLSFHKTERPVTTESAVQVREPLHRNAIGRSRNYAAWLGPLREALGMSRELDAPKDLNG
jgi:tetratricopeptide (TPR) repeat protein